MMKTKEELVKEIMELEIELSKYEWKTFVGWGNDFPKILKMERKLNKLREML